MLTGIRDLDHIILNKLEDKDLVNMCLVSKDAKNICDDQTFWLNRILSRFPKVSPEVFIRSKGGLSWSEYYIYDLRNLIDSQPNEILIDGAKDGKEDWVMISLNEGANIHAPRFRIHDAALRFATQYGHYEVIKILLKAGADVHAGDDGSLGSASWIGHAEIVKLLLGAGADVHVKNDKPLISASESGHTEVVKILLEAGANVNDEALRYAGRNGHTDVVKLLQKYM